MKVATKRRVTGRRVRGPAKAREGVGSVEVLPSGRFRVRVWVEGQKKGDTFATREEAEQQRATLAVMHRATAQALPPEPKALTLAAWGKTWLERREELGEVRRPQETRTRWDLYLGGTDLASMALRDIRPKHVQAWLDGMVKRARRGGGRISPSTIRHAFSHLRVCLGEAVRAEHTDANPCDGARLPKAREAPFAFLTTEEVAAVERPAPGVPEVSRRVFVVALFTGLRAGELMALRWGDVTLDGPRPEVHVQRSHDGLPKSGKGRRVPLFPQALDALRAQLAHLEADGAEASPDDLVFPTPRGCQYRRGDDWGWGNRKRCRKVEPGHRVAFGITRRVTFHALRHTCASHLVMGTWTDSPLELLTVRAILGHASVTTTQRYAHLSPGHVHDRIRGTNGARGTGAFVPRNHENAANPGVTPSGANASVGRHEALAAPMKTRAVGQAWDNGGLRARSEELLRAVDEGTPAGELARALALDVLRSAAPDSAPWSRAVAILEGGPLRMRHAVELAGLVMEAMALPGEAMTG